MAEDKLTTQTYWEKYYKESTVGRKRIIDVCSYNDREWDILFQNVKEGDTLIEIGGYPGRYLAYLASKYSVRPTCLDFNSDESRVKESFKEMGVEDYDIIQADFTKHKPAQQYDYVISNGFIEHFEDFDSIMDNHVPFVKPGGMLEIMIPNKRYLRKIYGRLVDHDNLKAHNLDCMSKKVFENFAERHNLETVLLEYKGGFPFSVHQELNFPQKVIHKGTRFLFKNKLNRIIERNPNKYFSKSLISIFRKPA